MARHEPDVEDEAATREGSSSFLEQAKSLVDAGDMQAALQLLQEHDDAGTNRRPSHDAAIGRLLLRADNPQAALTYLRRAMDAQGEKAAPGLRRGFAMALLGSGQYEAAGREFNELLQAGVKMTQPNCLAAVELFRACNDIGSGGGGVSPQLMIAKAKSLATAGHPVAAAWLLAGRRADYATVPFAYDAMLARLSMRNGDRETAISILQQRRDLDDGNAVEPNVRSLLGTALFEIGRVEEAGRELSLAIDGGAPVTRTGMLVAVNSYRRNTGDGEPIDTSFGMGSTFVDEAKRLVYVAIPKNASSLLKATFVMNTRHRDAYVKSGESIHEFCDKITTEPVDRGMIMQPGYFRFVVLRDPLQRLVSAYLDKFVRRRFLKSNVRAEKERRLSLRAQQVLNTIRWAQEEAGVPYDPLRSISFAEFVRFLAKADDAKCNMHWMPQTQITGTNPGVYHHIGKVDRLNETLDLLSKRFGFVPETSLQGNHARAATHIAHHSENAELAEPYRALPEELDAYENNMPMPRAFYSPELKRLTEERFAADVAFYAKA